MDSLSVKAGITANKIAAYKLLGIQTAITAVIALLLFLFFTTVAAWSALLGGFAYIIPNAWFIRSAYRSSGQPTPQAILSRFYLGEAGKLVLTGIIFALCFLTVEELHIGALFLTYIVMIIVNLAGLARVGMNN